MFAATLAVGLFAGHALPGGAAGREPAPPSSLRADKGADGAYTSIVRGGGATSVRYIFEKRGLMGDFALDCAKPAGGGNLYITHRSFDGDHVQREQMGGPATKDYSYVIDRAIEINADEIRFSMANEARRFDVVARIERNRMRTLKSTRDTGENVITDGRYVHGGAATPWFTRCGEKAE